METEPYGLDLVTQRRRDARDQNAEMNNEEERSKGAKPSNPGVDSDQTQAAKALGDGNRIGRVVSRRRSSGRKKQRCKNPATQALILTKPRRRKLQVMEIGSDVWFLVATPVEEKNTLESGFDLFWIWFVYGFLGLGSGEWDNIWRKKERKNKKKIRVSLSDVLSGLGWIEIEFRGLSFHLN